jgi:hypothetical protein
VSSSHFKLANSEILIRGKDTVTWVDRSHEEGAAGRASAIAEAPSRIGVQIFGEAVKHDITYADFPIGKSLTGTRKKKKVLVVVDVPWEGSASHSHFANLDFHLL